MPTTPTLNWRTDPVSCGANTIIIGAIARQITPSRVAQDFLAANTGRHTAWRAFQRTDAQSFDGGMQSGEQRHADSAGESDGQLARRMTPAATNGRI